MEASIIPDLTESICGFAETLDDNQRAALIATIRLASHDVLDRLHLTPTDEILSNEERVVLAAVEAEVSPVRHYASDQLVVVMKATRLCNLRCTYCHSWRKGPGHTMDFTTLVRATHGALSAEGPRCVQFVWHGGEVTLLPVEFFRKALWLQTRFASEGVRLENAVQTNGVRWSDEHMRFFETHDVSVGVSYDGLPELHDSRRLDIGGQGTSKAVSRFLKRTKREGIAHGVLLVVDRHTCESPPKYLLEHLSDLGVTNVGVLNVIPSNQSHPEEFGDDYLPWSDYIAFLCQLFDVWNKEYRDQLKIREFEELEKAVCGGRASLCYFSGDCMGQFLTVEPGGSLHACDKYVGDLEYKFGTLSSGSLGDQLTKSESLRRAILVQKADQRRMSRCKWFGVCHGGCPHDRMLARRTNTLDDSCCGYRPLLERMAAAAPTEYAQIVAVSNEGDHQ